MAKYNDAIAVLLNNGSEQILPVSKAQLIELAYNQAQGLFGDAKDVAGALTYLINNDAAVLEAAKTYTGSSINALNSEARASTGYVLSYVVEEAGKITEYGETWLDASVITYQTGEGSSVTLQEEIETIQSDLASAMGDGGSVSTQITNALDALDLPQVSENGKPITYVAQENGQVSAGVGYIDSQYVNVNNQTLGWDLDNDETADSDITVQSAIEHLQTEITGLNNSAARYSVTKIENDGSNLDANIKEQYKLTQTVNGQVSYIDVPINIYKDSQLVAAGISTTDATYSNGEIQNGSGEAALVLVYSVFKNNAWTNEVVPIPVADFFSELTAGSGLTESNGTINVTPDNAAETTEFLNIQNDSIGLQGIHSAIDSSINTYISGLDSEIVPESGDVSYVLTGIVEEDGVLTGYSGVLLNTSNVKNTTSTGALYDLANADSEHPQDISDLQKSLDVLASNIRSAQGDSITAINGDTDNTYINITASAPVGNTVNLTVDDSNLGNVALLQYDELTSWTSPETVSILGANDD